MEAQAKRPLTLDERRQLLDTLVGNILILQAAERDKVVVSDAELKTAVCGVRSGRWDRRPTWGGT